jgi:hypothetical protein
MAGLRAQSPAMAALPRRAPTKTIFLRAMIKMDVHYLHLLALILSETNSNLWILHDFVFQTNSDFNLNPSGLLPRNYISLGSPLHAYLYQFHLKIEP